MEIDSELPHTRPHETDTGSFDDGHISASDSFMQEYEGAAKTWGLGKTFMDVFDEDSFAHLRKECPYYPFSTKEEWKLAVFLLCSDLSMAEVNKFLKLSLVSFHSIFHSEPLMRYRFETSSFHSRRQKIYVAVQNFFHLDQTGNANHGKPIILRNAPSISFFATLSNVFNHSCTIHWHGATSNFVHSVFSRVQRNSCDYIRNGFQPMSPGGCR